MTRPLNSLGIVAPFYNEQAGARAFYDALCTVLEPLAIDLSFVFVDDGSQDRTLDILNEIAAEDDRVTVLSLARNFGHQIALTAGLDHASADVIITMDSDLQHPPDTIPLMLDEYRQEADVVYGVRRTDAHRGFAKRAAAGTFYKLLSRISRIDVIYGATDFRLMSRTALRTLRQMRELHRYLRGMVPWMGFPYAVVPFDQSQRHTGDSHYSWRQLARLASSGLFSFSTIPLDIITWLGVTITVLSGIYLLYVLATVLFASIHNTLPGWASTIAIVLIVSGVQLISIGILAQYIGMIFQEVKGRPLYTLKQGPPDRDQHTP